MNLLVRPMVNTPPLYIGVTLATFKASGKTPTSSEQRFISGQVQKCPGVDLLRFSIPVLVYHLAPLPCMS